MWNAWGIAWGDSWGTSWGPLHEVFDPVLEYRGNGSRAHPGWVDPLQSGEDLVQIVRDKWDAIEAAQARDLPPATGIGANQSPTSENIAPTATNEIAEKPENSDLPPGISMPVVAVDSRSTVAPVSTNTLRLADIKARKDSRQRARNEEAFILALVELL